MSASFVNLPQDFTVLVAEDNSLIAFDVECTLNELGVNQVVIVDTLEFAMKHLVNQTVHAAILDVRLRDATSFNVADRLAELGVPFGFATGYGEQRDIPEHLRHAPFIKKPYVADEICRLLLKLLKLSPRCE